MQQKIQELTDKIYQEGVQKGEAKAKEIVDDAKKRADKTIADAKKEAERIAEDAKKEAQELRRQTESEIKLAGRQAISGIKQQILDLITAQTINEGVSASLSSPDVVADLVKTIVQNWKTGEQQVPEMEVLLPDNKREELEKVFKTSVQKAMKEGIDVSFTRGIKGGFQIGPKDSTFKISLTDEDFSAYFKEFLRPKAQAFLFGDDSE